MDSTGMNFWQKPSTNFHVQVQSFGLGLESKDGSLSASWASFKDSHGALAPLLLELPMTKAAIKAMDVIGTNAPSFFSCSPYAIVEELHLCPASSCLYNLIYIYMYNYTHFFLLEL